jgi:hypothetical protein
VELGNVKIFRGETWGKNIFGLDFVFFPSIAENVSACVAEIYIKIIGGWYSPQPPK